MKRTASLSHSEDAIRCAVERIATAIHDETLGELLVFLPVLTGGLMFCHDLLDALVGPPSALYVEPIAVKRYSGRKASPPVFTLSPREDVVSGKTAIIVDDICDSGETLAAAHLACGRIGATRVLTATVLLREGAGFTPTWHGFTVPRGPWFTGYGMDGADHGLRCLPFIVSEVSDAQGE